MGLLTHVGLRILKISLLTHFKLTNLKKCSYVCLRVFKHIFDHLCFKVSSKQNDLFKLQIPTEKLINYKRTFYNNWFYPIISKIELYRSKICSKNKKKIPRPHERALIFLSVSVSLFTCVTKTCCMCNLI